MSEVKYSGSNELKSLVDEELYLKNVLVHTALDHYKKGTVSYENALLTIIVFMDDACKELKKELIRQTKSPSNFIH